MAGQVLPKNCCKKFKHLWFLSWKLLTFDHFRQVEKHCVPFMRQDIINLLTKYKNFDECIIEKIGFPKYGYQVEFLLHYIYDDKGEINVELNRKVKILFNGVHEFRVHNDWTPALINQPDKINWSHNEVALIKLADRDSYLLNKYIDFQNENKYYHCAILFQGGRRMDIVFNDMKITEAQ